MRSIPPPAPSRVPTWLLLPVALIAGVAGYAGRSGPDAPTTREPASQGRFDAGASPALSALPAEPPPPPTSPAAPTSASGPPPVEDAASLLARLKSIEAIAAKDGTVALSLELERGHVELALREVAALDAELGGKADSVVLGRLRRLAQDDAVAPAVLAGVAGHPSAECADFLDAVAADPHASDAVRYLAEDLLALPAIRGAASTALLVARDLAAAKSCPAVEKVARRAQEVGDDRAGPALVALESEIGCGPKRKDDCYPCLRGSTLLFEARAATASRPYVAPWKVRSP